MKQQLMIRKNKVFYGWWMVVAAIIMYFFGAGTFSYGFTVYFNPIRQDFGWTAAVTSIAFSLQKLEFGLLGPVTGYLADRVGPRKMMFIGYFTVGLGYLLMSRMNSLWSFYGTFMIMSTGFSIASTIVVGTAITHWFSKKRSRALALTYLGPGLSGILVPLLALSVGQFGWRETLVFASMAMWGINVPLSLILRHRPSQYGYLPDGEIPSEGAEQPEIMDSHSPKARSQSILSPATGYAIRETLKNRAFWLLGSVLLFQAVAQSAIMVHVVPYLESVDVPTTIAATAVTGLTICSLIGRFGFGFLGDFKSKRHLIAIALGLQACGLLIFSLVGMDIVWLIVLFLLTYGPGSGGPMPLRQAMQADYFGTKNFGTIMGLLAVIEMLGGLSSPVFAGWIFDISGSYRMVWRLFSLLLLPSIPLILLAKPPKSE